MFPVLLFHGIKGGGLRHEKTPHLLVRRLILCRFAALIL